MNVMIYNKYKDLLMGLKLEVMKSLEGVFNVDEIIDTFANFYYDKMILDITAIRDYQNTDNLQKLAMNINMENVILLLDDNPETNSKNYLSKLISLGIYNFTKNANGVNYLLIHPHTYKDVVNIHNIDDAIPEEPKVIEKTEVVYKEVPVANNGKLRIIGFKNVTNHAGSTSLIYMLKKAIQNRRNVSAIEINKIDFLYFNDKDMVSTTVSELPKEMMKRTSDNVLFVDLNDYEDVDICSEVYYLIEPSTIMINRLIKKNKGVLEKLRDEKVIINKCMLNKEDIATFEYETKLKAFFVLPCVDDRQDRIDPVNKLLDKMGL